MREYRGEVSNGSWQDNAACLGADPELFFYQEGERGLKKRARETTALNFCKVCPVVDECLDFAVSNDITFGLWGGMPEKVRTQYVVKELQNSAVRQAIAANHESELLGLRSGVI
ncbi:MAG: WhiB family transcriptional regulator [Candidatus Saccharimonadales bacterium]